MGTLVNTNQNTTATVYTAATEIVAISSSDPVNTLDASNGVMVIRGTVAFTPGATGGTVVAKVRQGLNTTSGTVVATVNLTNAVASTPYEASFEVVDSAPAIVGPGNAALPNYTITLTVAGSNGTGSFAEITVTQPNQEN